MHGPWLTRSLKIADLQAILQHADPQGEVAKGSKVELQAVVAALPTVRAAVVAFMQRQQQATHAFQAALEMSPPTPWVGPFANLPEGDVADGHPDGHPISLPHAGEAAVMAPLPRNVCGPTFGG